MYYIKTSIKTHCPQSLHTVVCSITILQKNPHAPAHAPELPLKPSAPQLCSITRQQKKASCWNPCTQTFHNNYIQSQDNKKRPHAGACTCSRLSPEQCLQTQDSKRKHHAPGRALLINQIFLL
jgi:hypothetical protein